MKPWLLALLLLLPSCFTRELWRVRSRFEADDSGSRDLEHSFHRNDRREAIGLLVRVTPSMRAVLRDRIGDATYVLFRPTAHEETFLEFGSVGRDLDASIEAVATEGSERYELQLTAFVWPMGGRYAYLRDLPGAESWHSLMAASFQLVFPVEVTPSNVEPTLGDDIALLMFERGRIVHDDESLLSHICWTPVTLLFDVAFSPCQLLTIGLWW